MKTIAIIGLLLSLFAGSAFALPSSTPMELLGEARDSRQELPPHAGAAR